MAFCIHCGKEIEDQAKFCLHCGAKVEGASAPVADPKDIADTRILALQAYLGILVLEPLFAAPKGSVFARYHANQGLILLILNGIATFTNLILGALSSLSWVLTVLLAPIELALFAALTFLAVMGIIHAIKGEMKELPFVGKFRLLK